MKTESMTIESSRIFGQVCPIVSTTRSAANLVIANRRRGAVLNHGG